MFSKPMDYGDILKCNFSFCFVIQKLNFFWLKIIFYRWFLHADSCRLKLKTKKWYSIQPVNNNN